MDYHKASIKDLKKLYRDSALPDQTMRHGFFRASFIGPLWIRLSAKPTLNLTGLPHWQGKRFLTENSATNVLLQQGRDVDALEMSLEPVTSYVDGSKALAFCYGSNSPRPWRWVRDELRAIDGDTLLGITFVDLPILRNFAFPFLLERAE